jgi:hypothetical protein
LMTWNSSLEWVYEYNDINETLQTMNQFLVCRRFYWAKSIVTLQAERRHPLLGASSFSELSLVIGLAWTAVRLCLAINAYIATLSCE